jgi:hypothetical protein
MECDVGRLGPGPGPGSVPAAVGSMVGVLLVLWELGDLKQMLVGNWDTGLVLREARCGPLHLIERGLVVGGRVVGRDSLRRVRPWGGVCVFLERGLGVRFWLGACTMCVVFVSLW